MTPSNTVNTLINANNNALTQATGTNVLKLVGFEEALKKLEQKCASPGEMITRENALYALVTINGAAGGLLSGVASSNISATVLNGGTIALSGATQLHSFFKNHFSIQEQQEMFIKAIADKPGVISNCTAPATLTHIPTSTKTILEALRKYGLIEVELATGDKFFLRNNGLCSIRLGIGSVVLLGISAGFAAAYGYFQYQAITSSQGVSDNMDVAVTTATPQAWGALAGASIPFSSLYDYIIRSVYSQEFHLLDAIDKIVKLYQRQNRLNELPIEVLQVSENYLEKDDATKNYNILTQAQTEAKINLKAEAHNAALNVANRKIERLEGELSTANTALGNMEQKMRDIEMQHTMTDAEENDIENTIRTMRENADNSNQEETTRLLDGHNNGAPMLIQQQLHSQANQTQANSANTSTAGEGSRKKPGCTIC